MIKVWILVFYMGNGINAGGPSVIDNIATKAECQRVASEINKGPHVSNLRCIEAWKVKPGSER